MRIAVLAGLAGLIALSGPALALDKVTFGTNWLADPEAGGYYQAVVDGTFAKYGLDVTIMPGGPQSNGGMLLVAGKIEFFMGGDMIGDFLSVEQNIPTIAVAAHFQKDPQIFMSHPGVGLDKWTDLPKATAFVSNGALNSFYAWMRLAWGFKDENVKPYNFNSGPFITVKNSIQQGYLTSEPFEVEKQGGFKPNVFLLADQGYSTYATLVETRKEIVEKSPDLVQRRRLGDRLVSLSLWRQFEGECGDQERQSRIDRRTDRLLGRQDEGIRHCRFRRFAQTGHRRDDRRAREGFLRQDGEGRHREGRHRLQEMLHAEIRQQRRRAGPAAEVIEGVNLSAHASS
jgi:NMT1/THI5 like